MTPSSTRLQKDLYRVLDRVIATGVAAQIEWRGHKLRIAPDRSPTKWERLEHRTIVNGDPEDLVHIDWTEEWRSQGDPP